MNWIEIKEGCDMPKAALDVQIVINGEVTSGYYIPAIPGSRRAAGGWMEYTLKGTDFAEPTHWQPMASPPEAA